MLQIFFGEMPEAIYNTEVYFQNVYEDEWITQTILPARSSEKWINRRSWINRQFKARFLALFLLSVCPEEQKRSFL